MLTIEEIKQAVEFADGFEICNTSDGVCLFNKETGLKVFTVRGVNWLSDYDLFLDRVIQGINREEKFEIYQQYQCIDIWGENNEEPIMVIYTNGTTEEIREAREKAIRFVLGEMK